MQKILNSIAQIDWDRQNQAIQRSLNSIAQIDWDRQNQAIQRSLNSIAQIDWDRQNQAIQRSLNSIAQIDWNRQNQAIQRSLNSIVQIDWDRQNQAIQRLLNSIAQIDWDRQNQAIKRTLNSISQFDLANYSRILSLSLKQFESEKLLTQIHQLSNYSISEIGEVINEYGTIDKLKNENVGSSEIYVEIDVNTRQQLTREQIEKIIEDRFQNLNSNKMGLKKFVQDLLISYGQDAVKYFINIVIFPFVCMLYGWIIQNHELVIETIQKSLSEEVYVIGYACAKKTIKTKGLSRYENLHLIGLTRIESFLRNSPNKNANPAYVEKIPVDTVVNILERKRSWFKIEVYIDNETIVGWIEESKVIKFKRKQ